MNKQKIQNVRKTNVGVAVHGNPKIKSNVGVALLGDPKGITLIALVITIVVLIILAGVAINLTLNNNGIFNKAKEGAQSYNQAEAKEKLETMLAEYNIEKITEGKTLLDFLNEQKTKGNIDEITDNQDGTYTVELNGYAITINESDLKITEIETAGLRPKVKNITITTDGTTLA